MKKRTKRRSNNSLRWIAAALAVPFFSPMTSAVYCADPVEPEAGIYRYDPVGKPDPFKPFIEVVEEKKPAQTAQKSGQDKTSVSLPASPLERFSTEEFRLSGIVIAGNQRIAMVETPEGKRYMLRKNTRIGINGGTVIKILTDRVIVLERVKDFDGNINTERIVLTLRKDGGNP